MYHPLYHLVRRVGNASVVCVTGVTHAFASFFASFLPDLASGENGIVHVRQILPVLGRFASFETGVANDLASTFRCNFNVYTPILPICQFCSDYQELSEFSYL